MNKHRIVFSPRARERLEEIADYLYQQQLSREFVLGYLNQFELWLEKVLGQFPGSGTPMPQFGEGIRRITYEKYSFVYRINNNVIEILTIYRENLP